MKAFTFEVERNDNITVIADTEELAIQKLALHHCKTLNRGFYDYEIKASSRTGLTSKIIFIDGYETEIFTAWLVETKEVVF